ncbi:MAG: hypothetical protein LBM27_05845 [Lactobacillaceae bacterium]|jgi:hypothetical protein|nr:hypothetical protein [Lactobacillaceae bacterium]
MLLSNNNLNQVLSSDLKQLNGYADLVNRFFESEKIPELNQITREILQTKINTRSVVINFDNSPVIWVTQLFAKLWLLAKLPGLNVVNNRIRFQQLENFEFTFVPANMNKSGFYLRENNQVLNILYFDVITQRLFFNADALAKLVNSNPGKRVSSDRLADFVKHLNQFADALLEDEFALDLNLIDYENDQKLFVDKVDVPVEVTDKLFLTATKNGFFIGALDDGFQISLDENISLFFQQQIEASGHSQWYFRVVDKKNEWSFLQVLQKFPFISNWYSQNISTLEIAYRDEIFLN